MSQAQHRPRPPGQLREPGDNATLRILREKWQRLNVNNEHWMLCIVGEEGSGKSYTALKIGSLVDPNFSADKVFFHPANMLERLKDGEYQSGDVWVLDEAGVGLGNRTWHDSGQVKLNQALQLVRKHNIGFIFTLPRLSELDKQAKGRLQNAYELVNKKDGEYVQGPWWQSSVDRMGMQHSSNEIWWSKPEMGGHEVAAVSFSPPSEEITEPYEETKDEFLEQFYDETIDELRGEGGDGGGDDFDMSPKEVAEEIRSEDKIDEYLRTINSGSQKILDADLISMDYGLGDTTAKRVKKDLMRDIDEEVM